MKKLLVIIDFYLINIINGYLSKSLDLNYSNPNISGGINHDCYRECKNHDKKSCYYEFVVSQDTSMSYSCKNCPFVLSDCYLEGCITGGGHVRTVSVVNHMLPGPSIQVCEGDVVKVNVINKLHSESTTIHWHGIHQNNTNYMDGVPFISQCPVLPNNKFIYEFIASPSGTHMWHSHIGFQEADGLHGSLIVRKFNDSLSKYYDYDIAEHVMIIWHWYDTTTESKLSTALHRFDNVYGYGFLINGLSSQVLFNKNNQTFNIPKKIFHVDKNKKYRFRVIFNSPIYCPVQVSIDDHKLLVIASETGEIEPVEVDSFMLNAGERYDFVLNANKKPKNYWIRYRGLGDCLKKNIKASEVAVLHYNEVENNEPSEAIGYENSYRSGVLLNPVNILQENYQNCSLIKFVDLNNSKDFQDNISKIPDDVFYFKFSFDTYYSYFIPGPYPLINNVAFDYPSSPLASQADETPAEKICQNGNYTNKKCIDNFCKCLSIYNVKIGSLVEMVFVDTSSDHDQDHPMHIHGHDFYVVSMETIGSNITLDYVKHLNQQGLIKKKFNRAPVKDNVNVPTKGFLVIRFIAKNPGYWIAHCHIANHMDMGMNFVLKVGDDKDIPKVPGNFPKCGHFY
ncbi:hypothetical protein HCN44_006715 [Aphidius gifuensis]|uniref:Laccase n=1 Tax=Aphidius gifuensis TaxID=684658 RepID=A0A834XXZ5_APHGI|nr:laccase-like [Aphidius gifuensis]KAF7995608.1 hypothetical protein HCN44_006715 [Aphidius gifuensis]